MHFEPNVLYSNIAAKHALLHFEDDLTIFYQEFFPLPGKILRKPQRQQDILTTAESRS